MTYHLQPDGAPNTSACALAGTGTVEPGDVIVSEAEAHDPDGRHFNCGACLDVVAGGSSRRRRPADEGAQT